MRFFEVVSLEHNKLPAVETILPRRGDLGSAGYDFRIKEKVVLSPNSYQLIFTDVKAFFPENEVLKLYMRSSNPLGLVLKNGTGIIDSSYYNNPKTGGNIGIPLWNIGNDTIVLQGGERICQGIFTPYYITNDDEPLKDKREGGFGSSGKY